MPDDHRPSKWGLVHMGQACWMVGSRTGEKMVKLAFSLGSPQPQKSPGLCRAGQLSRERSAAGQPEQFKPSCRPSKSKAVKTLVCFWSVSSCAGNWVWLCSANSKSIICVLLSFIHAYVLSAFFSFVGFTPFCFLNSFNVMQSGVSGERRLYVCVQSNILSMLHTWISLPGNWKPNQTKILLVRDQFFKL